MALSLPLVAMFVPRSFDKDFFASGHIQLLHFLLASQLRQVEAS